MGESVGGGSDHMSTSFGWGVVVVSVRDEDEGEDGVETVRRSVWTGVTCFLDEAVEELLDRTVSSPSFGSTTMSVPLLSNGVPLFSPDPVDVSTAMSFPLKSSMMLRSTVAS